MIGAVHYSIVTAVVLLLSIGFSAFTPMPDKHRKAYLTLSLGFLAFMTMFHSQEVGNDTNMYINRFIAIANTGDPLSYINRAVMEPGYILYNWVLSRVSKDPQILFIVSGAFIYFSIGRFLYRNAKTPGLIVYAIVTMLYFDTYLSAIRQTLALAIVLFAFEFLKGKRFSPFIIIVCIAATFHYSALIFLLAYPISMIKISKEGSHKALRFVLLGSVIVLAFVGFDKLISAILTLFPKYNYYNGSAVFGAEAQFSVVLKAAVFLLMYGIPRLLGQARGVRNRLGLVCQRFSIFNVILLLIAMNASVMTRLAGYFTPFALIDFAENVSNTSRENSIAVTTLSLILLFLYGLVIVVYRTPEWYTAYPFSLCFI